jgi:hypothetical protein
MPYARALRLYLFSTVLLLAPDAAAAPEELSPFAFKNLVERTRAAVVRVVAPSGGTAVIVGVSGELVADLYLLERDRLVVEFKGEKKTATLIAKDDELGLALLRLPPADYPAAAVGSAGTLNAGSALVGLSFDEKGKLRAEIGHFAGTRAGEGPAHLRTDVPGSAGTALFNSKGQLVALHAGRPRATFSIDDVRARFLAKRAP